MHYYFVFFVLYEILMSLFFYTQYAQKVETYHEKTLSLVNNSFLGASNTFSISNDNFHAQQADTLSKLVYSANDALTEHRDEIRKTLLSKFMGFYSYKKLDSFNGMHIFDKYGNSLLRFHQPLQHDDPIIEKRQSLKEMNSYFLYKHGLEIGVFQDSYRFQYPLFYDGEFVGSYEYSINYDFLMNEMKKFYGEEYLFLFKSKKIDEVVKSKIIPNRYDKITLKENSFYYKKNSYKNSYSMPRLHYKLALKDVNIALMQNHPTVVEYSFKSESFSLLIKPVEDITGVMIGYMLIDIKGTSVKGFFNDLIMEIIFTSLLSLVAYLYLIKQIQHRAYVRKLINLQHDILLVTDGNIIKDANQAFLDFFEFKTLKYFLKEHDCICDFFMVEDGFVGKDNDGLSWVDYIKIHHSAQHKVKIIDKKTSLPVVFLVELENLLENSLDNKRNFVVFRDITDEINNKKELENRANYDALTKIHNRLSFENHLANEIEKSARYGEAFSLIMFDIDHFKNVNDNYGHDIGDIILKEVTTLVNRAIRDVDFFARWGGEEFMIISNTDISKSEEFAEKLRELLEGYDFTQIEKLTCSFGLTQYHEKDTQESIIKRADTMLYSAKEAGRNCVVSLR